MRLRALRKVGVELQGNPHDTNVTCHGSGGFDGLREVEAKSAADERDDGLINEEEWDENFAEPNEEQKDVEPVDYIISKDSTSRSDRIDDRVRNTGLRTVRSLINGGLAVLALGALSPVGLLLKHLDGLKEGEDDVEAEERTEDDNDL